jgi:hypothetical protein
MRQRERGQPIRHPEQASALAMKLTMDRFDEARLRQFRPMG